MDKETAKKAVEAGANILTAASAIFNAENVEKAIEELRNAGK
jgi:pentose-5-phosphate-3-epimerase